MVHAGSCPVSMPLGQPLKAGLWLAHEQGSPVSDSACCAPNRLRRAAATVTVRRTWRS